MPKRRINGASEFAPTTTSTLEVEKDVDNNKWGTGFKRALGGATAGAFVFSVAVVAPSETGTVPEVNADEIVLYCGMGDNNNCDIYRSQLEATGQIRPGIDTVHPVPSPNSIWPLGPVTAEESVRISMEEGKRVRQEAINAASPGEPVVERGYSLGALPLVANANERTGGGPVPVGSVIADGGPVTDSGVFNPRNNLVETMLPIAGDLLNIPTHHRAPAGTIARGSEQDIWYNGSQQDLGRLIGQAMDTFMGPAHAVQHPDGFHHVWTDHNGVVHNTFPGTGTGGPTPGLGMGGAPVPPAQPEVAPAPVQSPIVPETNAVSREWKRNHPERYPEFAAQEAEREEVKESNKPVSTYGSHSSRKNDDKEEDGNKWEPPVRAGMYGKK